MPNTFGHVGCVTAARIDVTKQSAISFIETKMMLVSKICAAILLAVLRLGAGLLPLKVYQKLDKWSQRGDIKATEKQTINKRRKRVDLFMSVFLCFGAGLLLSTCFIHMIPEVIKRNR